MKDMTEKLNAYVRVIIISSLVLSHQEKKGVNYVIQKG